MADSALVARVPLVAKLPDQPPEAVQAVALVEDHVKVDEAPRVMLVGLALKVTLGGAAVTVTVADWDAEPPVPVQVSVNLVVALIETVACVPLVASAPVQPPEAAQDVAFVDDQTKVALEPLWMVLGLAVSATAGAGCVTETVADCVALPPAPVQVSV